MAACPPLCYGCGVPVGHLTDFVRTAHAKTVEAQVKKEGTQRRYAALDPVIKSELGKVLDAIGVHYECCRSQLLCAIDIRDR